MTRYYLLNNHITYYILNVSFSLQMLRTTFANETTALQGQQVFPTGFPWATCQNPVQFIKTCSIERECEVSQLYYPIGRHQQALLHVFPSYMGYLSTIYLVLETISPRYAKLLRYTAARYLAMYYGARLGISTHDSEFRRATVRRLQQERPIVSLARLTNAIGILMRARRCVQLPHSRLRVSTHD